MRTWIGVLSRSVPLAGPWTLKTDGGTFLMLGDQPSSLSGALVKVAGTEVSTPRPMPGVQGSIEVRWVKRVRDSHWT